jgi:hypothetical protein
MKLQASFPSICAEKRIPINKGGEGYRFELGAGARLSVLAQGGRGLSWRSNAIIPQLPAGSVSVG